MRAHSSTVRLLAAALLLGGLRDPRLAALGEAAVFVFVWRERPALGPAAVWLPWLAWACLSALWSAQPFAASAFLARWSAVPAFFSLAASWGEGEREEWLKTLLGATVLLASAALWTGAPLGFRAAMTGLIPPYYNYTTFALSAGTVAGAVWALHPRTARREFRLAGFGVAALGLACLALAHGRAAVIGVLIAAAVWAVRRWGMKVGFAVVAVSAVALSTYWLTGATRHGGRYQEARGDIWRRAVEIADGNPLLGVGPGNFGAAFRLQPVEARGGAARWGLNTDFAHSEPLQAAAETGWMGLALWLIGLGTALSVLLSRAHEEPAREAAAIAAVAMAVHLAVDNMLQLPGLAMLFFSALAVMRGGGADGRRWPRSAAVFGALLALAGWIPRALADADPARAAALFPREAYPREDLAYRAMAAGNLAAADSFWEQAERRAPYDAVYPWRRAQIAAAQGRWEAAESWAERAISLEPFFLNARVLRAEALHHLGRSQNARAELLGALRAQDERGDRLVSPGYETLVWEFDRKNYDRVAALIGRAPR